MSLLLYQMRLIVGGRQMNKPLLSMNQVFETFVQDDFVAINNFAQKCVMFGCSHCIIARGCVLVVEYGVLLRVMVPVLKS